MPTSHIKPFTENKIAQSESLKSQYKIAQNLLHQYQQKLKPATEIFDIDKMAKFVAVGDILGAYHGLFWHNQRYYYNPVISRLEPIGYDGFGGAPRRDPLLLGKALIENEKHIDNEPLLDLFNDPDFIEQYMYYLDKFTSNGYFENFYAEIENELNARINFINEEFPNFKFNKKKITNRINQIRFKMLPYDEHSVQASWVINDAGDKVVQLSNSHVLPLKLVGFGAYQNWVRDTISSKIFLPAHKAGFKREIVEIDVPSGAQFVFYKPYGIDTLFTTTISPFSMPDSYVPVQEIYAKKKPETNDLFFVVDNEIVFQKGNYIWDKDIIIPEGYRVIFEAGVKADMINGSKFISKSPVFLNGTNENPILIFSSDKSANGFTVLQAKEESKLYYTVFKDLNTLNYNGWTLTGAVTFYESDVLFKNCLFKDNHCEDALNTIRSSFKFEDSMIENTFADGFDADFCKGIILNSKFKNTGNDCIDFSGSEIEVVDSEMLSCGDKGVSVGEESYVIIDGVLVDGATIGAASKDLSYIRIHNIDLKNCNQGFAAYQKKPEYGGSSIFVLHYTEENVKYLRTIAPRCTLEYRGNVYVGEE